MNTHRWKKITVHVLLISIFLLACLAPISGVAHAQVPQTSCSEIWDTLITVSNSLAASRTLRIGQGILATNNLDDCDQPAPPLPPGGSFEALISFGATDYFTDYRPANLPGTITWLVKFQAGSGGDPVTFSWTPATLPGAGTWTLIDSLGGGFVNVNMRSQSSLVLPLPGLTQLEVRYATTRCTVTAVASGSWNSTSTWNTNCTGIPAVTDDVYIPNGITVSFNNAATTVESLTLGRGGSLTFANANQLLVSDNAFVRGGSLLLGSTGNFVVNGALTNLGLMQQTKGVTLLENQPLATVSFMNIGGYGGMTITSHSSLGNTTVRITGGQVCDTNNTSVWRCFVVTSTNNVTNAEINFYFASNELNGSTCPSMQAWRSTGGHNWVSAGTVQSRSCASAPYSIHYTSMTVSNSGTFFGLRSSSAPTAITLRTFSAGSLGSNLPIPLALALAGLVSLSAFILWQTARKRALDS